MNAFFTKMKSKAGETLIETLAAILIFTMASIVMFTLVNTAANINMTAKQMDAENQANLIAVEKGLPSAINGNAIITFSMDYTNIATANVDIYGGQDGTLFTYFLQPAPGEGGTP